MIEQDFQLKFALSDDEQKDVIGFVAQIYRNKYDTEPPKACRYSVVSEGEQTIACMGIDDPVDDFFLIEHIYQINRDDLPLNLTGTNGVQFGRLVAINPKATPIAIYGAARFASQNMNRTYAIVEHDIKVHRALLRMGIHFWDVPRNKLNLEVLPPHNREYYFKDLMLPYLVNLEQIVNALSERVPLNCRF